MTNICLDFAQTLAISESVIWLKVAAQRYVIRKTFQNYGLKASFHTSCTKVVLHILSSLYILSISFSFRMLQNNCLPSFYFHKKREKVMTCMISSGELHKIFTCSLNILSTNSRTCLPALFSKKNTKTKERNKKTLILTGSIVRVDIHVGFRLFFVVVVSLLYIW